MFWESRRPAAPLRPHVRAYTGYRVVTAPAGVHRGVPDGRMTFIVSLADDIRILQHVDLHPKAAARALRFGRVVGHLRAAGGRRDLARLAARAGYYDQSHLTCEFHAMAGCAPTTWIAEEFPSVQDAVAPAQEDRPIRPGDHR